MRNIQTDSASTLSAQPPMIHVCSKLAKHDYVKISATSFLESIIRKKTDPASIGQFLKSWADLEADDYMADGGNYRFRRYSTFSAAPFGGPVQLEPHQPHYQKVSYNHLNGGVERMFAPFKQETIENPVFKAILDFGSRTFGALSPFSDWHIEAHQFRIKATPDGGNPIPEGHHQDGVDYILIMMVQRSNIIEGETSITNLEGHKLKTLTLMEPFETVLLNDHKVAHGVTPILRLDPDLPGYRDVLVITFRRT